jgi:hypothetical protein
LLLEVLDVEPAARGFGLFWQAVEVPHDAVEELHLERVRVEVLREVHKGKREEQKQRGSEFVREEVNRI